MRASRLPVAVRRRATRLWRRTRLRVEDPIDLLARRGLFDLEFYQAQFATDDEAPATMAAATAHYRSQGRALDLAFHPFYEPEWWGGRDEESAARKAEVEARLGLGELWLGSPSPLLADAAGGIGEMSRFLLDIGRGRRGTGLPKGWDAARARRAIVDRVRSGYRDPVNDGGSSGTDWDAVAEGLADRVVGRVSVIVATFQDWRMTVDAVRAALAHAGDADIEVLVVENGSRPAVFRLLTAVFVTDDRVRVLRSAQNTNFSGAMNIGAARSTGELVLLLNNDAVLGEGWWPPLRDALDDDEVAGAQPLILYPGQGRIQAAGTMFLGEGTLPWHFLAGHPVEDARRAAGAGFRAVTAAVLLLRARDLVAAHGFDEGFRNGYEDVDLCLRMTADGRRFVVVVDSVAEHPEGSSEGRSRFDSENRQRFLAAWAGRMPSPEAWRYSAIGARLVGMRPWAYAVEVPIALDDPHLVRPRVTVRGGLAAGLPSLRWSLCLSAGADPHTVEVLRADLGELGQDVVSFTSGSAFADCLDDVLVAFAADARYAPRSATFNLLVAPERIDDPRWDLQTAGSWTPDAASGARLTALTAVIAVAAGTIDALFSPEPGPR